MASHRPRLVPWPGRVTGPFPVLYADAFFLDGDLRKKPGHLAAGEPVPKAARWQNGWGYVLLLDGHVFYDYGVIRPEHLAPFAARKAFIYVLEIVAQVLPLVTFASPDERLREGPLGQWHPGLLLGPGVRPTVGS